MMPRTLRGLFLVLALVSSGPLAAQEIAPPKILIVTAHPDDEWGVAATVYKTTHDLKGVVDLALITNGEGGYKYSTLANAYYGLDLTDEKVGREYLPTIRKRELMNGGRIIGIRNYYFFDQVDHAYTLNVDTVLQHVWDVATIRDRLRKIMLAGEYDYLFVLLPTPDTHGHHKGASILALETVRDLPAAKRPVVLGVSVSSKSDSVIQTFTGLEGYPVTKVSTGAPSYSFDRTMKFGFRDALDYRIVANWVIAEHKSQGTVQMLVNRGDVERFWNFDLNDPSRAASTARLFEILARNTYPTLTY